ncbi:MAG: hypothetical protein ALECFALPRED_007973 [Alectoria fallacina]|uniref:Uncharacterized protein n=1 Tax=Alectoria fallacina TaxID=1903189 RepID=A0A8H3PDQ6_9LECA|nr:MAG: hypothetical protein ALECFALPRED_007973 [Alectoria fallacina]
MISLAGKVVSLTGSASGMGLATAQAGKSITAVDIRESSQVNSWIEKTVSQFGCLDGAAIIARVLGKKFGVHDLTKLCNQE